MDSLILKGEEPKSLPLDMGLAEYFFERAGKIGQKIFQIDGNTEETETYAQTRNRSTRVALSLKDLGLCPKDVTLLCCNNGLNNIIPVFATLYLGGYVSSVDPRQTTSEVKYLIGLVNPKFIFVDEVAVKLIENSTKELKKQPQIIVIGSSTKYLTMQSMEAPHEGETTFLPVKQKGDDIAFIQFSSGSTGAQKGIYLSNKGILDAGRVIIQHGTTKPGVLMHMSSFYWISAALTTGSCIVSDSAKVVGSNITGERFLQLVDKFKITYLFSSNTFSYQISNLDEEVVRKYDTSSFYSLLIGGAVVHPSQILKLRQLLPHTKVSLAYGSTEANFISAFDYKDDKAYKTKLGSSGTVPPNVELKVVNRDTQKPLGPNKIGEIWVRSPYIMKGYHNLNVSSVFDEDGFLKVGDIGYYDEDHYIYVTGRTNEVFKYQTTQIVPSDIEQIILSHPDVQESVVFGIPHRVDNNHPAAVIVLKSQRQVSVDDLIKFTDSQLPVQKRLRGGIILVDDIPKTPSGKVQRRSVMELFIKRLATGA